MSDVQRRSVESIINLTNTAYTRARGALTDLRQDESLLALGVDYVNHIELELTEAMRRLDGARFAGEALLAKLPKDEG